MTTFLIWYCIGYATASHLALVAREILDWRRERRLRRRWRGH